MILKCYKCKEEKSAIDEFAPSRSYGFPSKIICRECSTADTLSRRNKDPKDKWKRFNFTWGQYGNREARN